MRLLFAIADASPLQSSHLLPFPLQRFTPEGTLADESKEVTIEVRPGWKRGTKVTFLSEGDEAPGIVPADVIFVVAEAPHAHFVRDGTHLVHTARLSLADALADCVLEVPTLDGRVLSLPCPEVSALTRAHCRCACGSATFIP